MNITKATGQVVAAAVAGESGQVDILPTRGHRFRLALDTIAEENRPNRGEQLVDLSSDDTTIGAVFFAQYPRWSDPGKWATVPQVK